MKVRTIARWTDGVRLLRVDDGFSVVRYEVRDPQGNHCGDYATITEARVRAGRISNGVVVRADSPAGHQPVPGFDPGVRVRAKQSGALGRIVRFVPRAGRSGSPQYRVRWDNGAEGLHSAPALEVAE